MVTRPAKVMAMIISLVEVGKCQPKIFLSCKPRTC